MFSILSLLINLYNDTVKNTDIKISSNYIKFHSIHFRATDDNNTGNDQNFKFYIMFECDDYDFRVYFKYNQIRYSLHEKDSTEIWHREI